MAPAGERPAVGAGQGPGGPAPARHCPGCGREEQACGGRCGRREGPARFCAHCGRRLQEIAVSPGLVAPRCRDHGPGA